MTAAVQVLHGPPVAVRLQCRRARLPCDATSPRDTRDTVTSCTAQPEGESVADLRTTDTPPESGARPLTTQTVRTLLRHVPCLADAVAGRGPLASSWHYGMGPGRPVDRPGLERLIGSELGISFLLASLDAPALALAQVAAWYGGVLTRGQARREAPGLSHTELDEAAGRLRDRQLTESDEWVALRPLPLAMVDLPGDTVTFRMRHTNSDVLAEILRVLGHAPPPRKAERLDALAGALRDPGTLAGVRDRLPAAAGRALDLLVRQGPQRVADLGVPYWSYYQRRRDGAAAHRAGPPRSGRCGRRPAGRLRLARRGGRAARRPAVR